MFMYLFFFKQKTAYEMRISDWSSDVCSSDLRVSTDNGVSYYAASGDYKTLTAGTGVENNSGGLSLTFTASTAARSGVTRISGNLGDGNPPVAESKIGRASCRERVCQKV